MYVAPLTTSIFALPAFSASSRRMGSARALIASVRALSPLSSTVSTFVSSPPVSVTRTEMIENGVVDGLRRAAHAALPASAACC